LEETFPTGRELSDRVKFRGQFPPLLPCCDATVDSAMLHKFTYTLHHGWRISAGLKPAAACLYNHDRPARWSRTTSFDRQRTNANRRWRRSVFWLFFYNPSTV